MEFTKENTEILSVKILKETTLGVAYNDGTEVVNLPIKLKRVPHKDFTSEMTKLKPLLKESLQLIDKAVIEVTGFSLSEHPKKGRQVVVKGTLITGSGIASGQCTEAIQIENGFYDCIDIDEVLDNILVEAKKYLFEGKAAFEQMAGDFQEEDDLPEELNNDIPDVVEPIIEEEAVEQLEEPIISEEDRKAELKLNEIKEEPKDEAKTDEELANEMIALRQRASELGIKNWHLLGKDKLIGAIAEIESAEDFVEPETEEVEVKEEPVVEDKKEVKEEAPPEEKKESLF